VVEDDRLGRCAPGSGASTRSSGIGPSARRARDHDPLDFLDFRDLLTPPQASVGAVRLIEIRLGLRLEGRLKLEDTPFDPPVSENDRRELLKSSTATRWSISSTAGSRAPPSSKLSGYAFSNAYREAVIRGRSLRIRT